jgi:hypothetical protein
VKLDAGFPQFDFLSPWEGDDRRCRATRRRKAEVS